MVKKIKLSLFLCALAAAIPAHARFSEGLILGGFAGLTAGLIGSAIAKNCSGPDVVVVEEPVMVYEEPCVVYETPQVVYERQVCRRPAYVKQSRKPKRETVKTVVETRTITRPEENESKRRELALKERQLELDLIKEKKELMREENRKKELAMKEKEIQRKQAKAFDKEAFNIAKETTTKTVERSIA